MEGPRPGETAFLIAVFPVPVALVVVNVNGQVIELDESFSERRQDRAWLVEFYAPWCGHCRQLEPTYHQVALELKNSEISVAKIDATRYTRFASEFEVRGYPTIKFIQGNRLYTHHGERTKEDIIEFARRAYGPQIRPLSNQGKLHDARGLHANSVFFVYVGPVTPALDEALLYSAYKAVAEKFAVLSYFYAADSKAIPDTVRLSRPMTVIVFKDGTFFEFNEGSGSEDVGIELERWVNIERFATLPKLSGVGLNEMSHLGKRLVIVVTDEKDKIKANNNDYQRRVKDIVLLVAKEQREKYHSYQFAWLTDADTASNIVMQGIDVPFVFILDPSTQHFYLPPSTDNWTEDDLTTFLDGTLVGVYEAHGGSGLGQRFKRLFYDIWSTIYGIYHESPWLALMVFGIPTFVISIICYALCCLEPMEDDGSAHVDSEGEDEDDDEYIRDGAQGDSSTLPAPANDQIETAHSKKTD